MSKTPITASSEAAVVSGMPWSWAAGMKWVPTRPFVLAPQIAKPMARYQKCRVRAASRSTRTARAAAPPSGVRTAGVRTTGSVAPSAVRPISSGVSLSRNHTSGTTASAAAATVSEAHRHPCISVKCASTGRKISCPVAPFTVSTPVTRPRCRTNQRSVSVAAKTSAIEPVPSPTRTPHSATSCQLAVMNTVRPLPAATSSRAQATTRRMPKRSMSAAANGAHRPYSMRFTETASEIVPLDQPNASSSGVISTPGVARNPAAPMIATKATAATIHARCSDFMPSILPSCRFRR